MSQSDDQPSRRARQLRDGSEQALADLFDGHRERLWRMVSFRLDGRLRGRLAPDDVLQDAYVDAAKRIRHFEGETELSAFLWLRMVVQQTLIDLHRRHLGAQMRDAGREVALHAARSGLAETTAASLVLQLTGHWTSPSRAAARADAMSLVERAIAGMDPLDREILALRHFEELTNAEAAAALDIQPKAASIRYVRALRRLKEILADVPGFMDEG